MTSTPHVTVTEIHPNQLDGVLALRTLLAHEWTLEIYRRQIVIIKPAQGEEFIYAHGVPDTTALTSAMTAQHKRMRRALVRRQEVAIPDGATFPMGTGIPRSKTFAQRLGYPVVVKPATGDPGAYWFTNVASEAELDAALSELKTPVDEREGIFTSGYTPLVLGHPGEEEGRRIVPRNYRYLIEQRMSGELIRFLVNDGEILSALRLDGSPSDGSLTGAVDVLAKVHPALKEKVITAYRAIPDLALAAIDVVTNAPGARLRRQKYGVVDFTERPFLWVNALASPASAVELSERILNRDLVTRDLAVRVVPDTAAWDATIAGLTSANGNAVHSLEETGRAAGVVIDVRRWDPVRAIATASLSGHPLDVAAFLDALTNDLLGGTAAQMVEITMGSDADD